ncbi:MAG: hypothetical protein H7067_03525 [Burkholderiales bacterium]|nr:hypothetical protein [Opitutaceae bacterium]
MSSLVNAIPVEVEYLDGKREAVQLARLSIRQLYLFCTHLAAVAGPDLAALCTGRTLDWIDTLTPQSFAVLHRRCTELNFPKAAEVAKGDPRLAAKLMPFLQDQQMLMLIAMGATLGLDLNDSSKAPPASESKEEATSDASTSPPSGSAASSPSASASAPGTS